MRAAMAFISLLLCCAPAWAQDTRWTAPSGAWSIDYASQGWTFADPLPANLQYLARIMIPLVAPPDDEVRLCAASESRLDQSASDPAMVRSTAGRMDMDIAAGMYAPRRQSVTGVSAAEINGVSVADISTRSQDGRMSHLHRVFYMPVEGRVLVVDIDCLWPTALDPAKAAEIPAVLGTLAINSMSETQ